MQASEDFTKAGIKSRLTQKAAEMWGYSEADMDGFDPLVQMLLEACAVELEKIGQEINNTQYRLVERLAGLLNPDVVDAPHPAHAVAQAQPREPILHLPADAQFAFQRPAAGRAAAGPAMFFSPLQATRLTEGAVRYLATDSQVWRVETAAQKRLTAVASQTAPAEHRRLWIGLELHPDIESLADLTFYFDWLNEPRREAYFSFLPGETWRLGELVLPVAQGLDASLHDATPLLHQEYDFLQRVEQHVRNFYAPGFVRLLGAPDAELQFYMRETFPATLAPRFSAEVMQTFTQPLVWLEVRFSHALPPEALNTIACGLNCFPVLNRRLNKQLFRLQPALNIFPLQSEEAFLAIREVYSLRNVIFRSTTLSSLQEGATDTYTLRYGAGRFDARSGKEALLELLELLRDESRAFTATGTDFVSNTLRELNQNLARLEERLAQANSELASDPAPYVMLRPHDPNDSVYLEYWSSDGEGGNRLPTGSNLQVYDGHYLDRVQLLTTTTGGRERPRPEERVHALRKNLLSRNRIVTVEDIRAACWAELGNQLGQVRIEKGFRNGTTPTAGFVRCIRVQLTPALGSRLSAPEWQRTAQELQVLLASQSAMNLPYEVSVATN
ncbi:type VI secretion system baseplate subunit TssF [Hymenobacter tibetensis]|uniref:Type VI secretion system baseplate subunit TssF n=1 Tax=Hymenobacter tibetensis TaxID=497967 RepID=A0ABY4CYY5_9BACT|nr:type VI secretion system baseplate subunit TssF [Hymenobacter tibetensis]UOG74189.1 type VI secretion system baseplate subunit TssF [Hymenobacter tibetensis]